MLAVSRRLPACQAGPATEAQRPMLTPYTTAGNPESLIPLQYRHEIYGSWCARQESNLATSDGVACQGAGPARAD